MHWTFKNIFDEYHEGGVGGGKPDKKSTFYYT